MKPNSTFIERAIAGVKYPVNAAELHDLVQPVGALAGLPYWYRGWTIQEATASGTVRLHYGTSYCHIKSWVTLASCLERRKYHDQDIDCVCYRTWCGGMADDQPFGHHPFEAAKDESDAYHTPPWSAINNQVSNRRFIVTKQGYIGLVPDSAQVGDCVAILASGSMPFIPRKVETRLVRRVAYIMVGGYYIDGIMHGEAVKTAALQAILHRGFELAPLAALTKIPLERLVNLKKLVTRKKESDEELAFNSMICLV